ncbi:MULTISPECIES: proline--tRNA ligase [Alicyclobacillus]|uniref:Proline--tRNA ligase n=1 Tax=Alicyclobacillus acidoterrestris (strain ATCC 49025 / DSM 3922 / CIP 106132 / NCIMB 13137 / GD3B) TaxID=1356854 RepID=T0BTV5_ALIAG|nr:MULTISPECIES: proline--tRNA ligase [Alicyclobacillus]EPZ47508.1 prolyl-tRNA synthetase [Alicyclobacillus acidoterrestris ATCC 49025]UNO48597.1 proline--tRNA ligase [Alicyclobacillus acidoterrestris]
MAKENKAFVKEITPQSEDFSRWYLDVIQKADLMDYSPVRGCIVFKPDAYEMWEACQRELDKEFKRTGHRNAYFPLFIPESFFQKEKEHVEGFNPELPWVTEAGGDKLEERLAIRPTSETMIGHMYAQWIQSYRDLPLLLNQWANVVRWEKRTLPFLRTSEFLWQEGHTAHASEEEARQETMQMLDIYTKFVEEFLAVPVIRGQKTPSEKFAGAVDTYSIEAMMKDGKALQAGTSHFLGQNFAKGFDIQYLDKDNQLKYVYTTSWGISTRLLGALIMVHGDDRGLVLPPKVAPTQVVIIPIGPQKARAAVVEAADSLFAQLRDAGIRVRMDARDDVSPGWKFNEYEMRGIPVRLEIGPRDLENRQVVLVRRDTGEKTFVPLDELNTALPKLLDDIQVNMFETAKKFREEHSYVANTLDELVGYINDQRGFVLAGWCGSAECEKAVKDACSATSRNIPFEAPAQPAHCVNCQQPAKHAVWFAKSY